MKVFLMTKGHYYRGSDSVDGLPHEALEFPSVGAATQFALRKHLPDAEVALRYDSADGKILRPSFPEWCARDEAVAA